MTDRELLEMILVNQKAMTECMDSMTERMDTLESQIKSTERVLKNEIRKSEELVLDEVERVHNILYKHTQDSNKHTA